MMELRCDQAGHETAVQKFQTSNSEQPFINLVPRNCPDTLSCDQVRAGNVQKSQTCADEYVGKALVHPCRQSV